MKGECVSLRTAHALGGLLGARASKHLMLGHLRDWHRLQGVGSSWSLEYKYLSPVQHSIWCWRWGVQRNLTSSTFHRQRGLDLCEKGPGQGGIASKLWDKDTESVCSSRARVTLHLNSWQSTGSKSFETPDTRQWRTLAPGDSRHRRWTCTTPACFLVAPKLQRESWKSAIAEVAGQMERRGLQGPSLRDCRW